MQHYLGMLNANRANDGNGETCAADTETGKDIMCSRSSVYLQYVSIENVQIISTVPSG